VNPVPDHLRILDNSSFRCSKIRGREAGLAEWDMEGRYMKRTAFITVSIVLVLAWSFNALPVVSAQTMSRQSISANESRTNTWSADAAQEPQTGSRHNAWLQGDERQQAQLMGCYRLSADLEQHTQDVYGSLSKNPVDWQAVRDHFADIEKGYQFLIVKHEEFESGLSNGQRSWWESRLREILAVEFKLQARMGAIEGDLKEQPTRHTSTRKLFNDLRQLFKEWKNDYGLMGADMDIQNIDQKATGTIRGLSGNQNSGR
jgi:hypothetical protein